MIDLYRYTEWIDGDDGIDIGQALLLGAKGNHVNVVDVIVRRDDDAFNDDSRNSVLHVKIKGNQVWKIAVLEGLSCIFEVSLVFFIYIYIYIYICDRL